MLGDLLYRLGSTLGTLEGQLRGMGVGAVGDHAEGAWGGSRERLREVAVFDPDSGEVHDLDGGMSDSIENAALAAAGAWILSRFFRPRDISWPRVVFAGIAATARSDLMGRSRDDGHAPGFAPYAEDPEELISRFGAGIAVAAAYAALLYPRIPGPPLLRGLAFGALEIAAAPRGGLVGLASAAPGVKFPLQALALPVDEDASPISHLAFGLALGLLYRYDVSDDD